MNPRNPLLVAAVIFFVGFTAVTLFLAFQGWGIVLFLLISMLFMFGVLLSYRGRLVLIDEMEVGVIFNRFNNSFCRFHVSPDPTPDFNCRDYRTTRLIPFATYWLKLNDPYHIRLRWHEELTGKISKKALSTSGKVTDIRTSDGVPVTIPWKVSYNVDVSLIPEKLRHKMARALPENSDKMVAGKAERAIKHLIENQTIHSLYGPGAIQALEQQLCQRIHRQLTVPVNLGFKEIPPKDVTLGPIEIPSNVEKALELAHSRQIQTEMVAGSLERLQRAVNGFSKEDIRRLSELERLRILDDKEVRSLYLSDAFIRSESVKVKKNLNGRSQA